MGLTIHEQEGCDMGKVTVDRRLWLAADRETLVEDGDPAATFLWAACAGREVPADEAERVGYTPRGNADTKSDRSEPEAAADPEPGHEPADPEHVCDCGYEAKSKAGLAAHKRSHDD